MRFQSCRLRCARSCFKRLLRCGDHVHGMSGKDCFTGFGGFERATVQRSAHGIRHNDAIALENGQCIGTGGGVRHRRAAGDDAGVITRHVADGQRHHTRGRTGRGQPPALDAREMLAHTVHFRNIGTGVQQILVDALLVFERQPLGGQREQGRAATRDQTQHQIVFCQSLRQCHDALRCSQTRGIGHGMRGFHQLDSMGQTCWPRWNVVIPRHHQAS